MILQLALLLSHVADPATTAVRLWNLTVSGDPGSASDRTIDVPADVVLAWQSQNTTINHSIKIYQNNDLVDTISALLKTWTLTLNGFVENDDSTADSWFAADWRFRVELVDSAGTIIDVAEGTWRASYARE